MKWYIYRSDQIILGLSCLTANRKSKTITSTLSQSVTSAFNTVLAHAQAPLLISLQENVWFLHHTLYNYHKYLSFECLKIWGTENIHCSKYDEYGWWGRSGGLYTAKNKIPLQRVLDEILPQFMAQMLWTFTSFWHHKFKLSGMFCRKC